MSWAAVWLESACSPSVGGASPAFRPWERSSRRGASGFSAALADAGLDPAAVPFLYGDCSFGFGAGAGARFVLGAGSIDGVFCQTDLMAVGLIQGLRDAGKRVPEEVSVMGYDDIELGAYVRPRLSTIHQPIAEMASLACERLMCLVGGIREGRLQKLIAPSLVVRES